MTENALTPELEKEIRRIVREEMQAAKREEQEFNSTRTCAYCEGRLPREGLGLQFRRSGLPRLPVHHCQGSTSNTLRTTPNVHRPWSLCTVGTDLGD